MINPAAPIARSTTVTVVLLALFLALVPPAIYFAMSYSHMLGALEAEGEINARLVRGLVIANPSLWQFEDVRLSELLQRRSRKGTKEVRRLYNLKHEIIAESADPLVPPLVFRTFEIQDAGRTVAVIEIGRSLAPTVSKTLGLLGLGVLLALVAFQRLRTLPLHALDEAQRELKESEEKYRSLYVSLKEGVALYRAVPREGGRTELLLSDLNPACEVLFGFTRSDIGTPIAELLGGVFAPYVGRITGALKNDGAVSLELEQGVMDRHINLTAFRVGAERVATILEDVTQQKRSAEQLERLAFYDGLTGLFNRSMLLERLDHVLAVAQRERASVAILFIDLDRFKVINDTLGHQSGDLILIEVSRRLQRSVRKRDTLARLGGDEFVAACTFDKEESAGYIAKNLLNCITGIYEVGGREVYLGGSIGIAVFPEDGDQAEVLLKNADIAMYNVKNRGGDFCFYSAELNEKLHQRMRLDFSLRRALEKGEFFFEYQPIIDARSGRICAIEALLRWDCPERGRMMPVNFIPLAEETGLILPLGEWVLRTACAKLKAWREAGFPAIRMCVNISGRQFMQGDIYSIVESALTENGVDPNYLELELTESCLIHNVDDTIRKLNKLKALKVTLAIDDFGTGYSSLQYLKNFPIDRLKIDRGFVKDACQGANHRAIVDAVIGIAKALDLLVTAEGVETVEQAESLKGRGCDALQGFYYYRPLAEEPLLVALCSQGDSSEGNRPPSPYLATRLLDRN